jgi:hypothetical protein
MRSEFGQLADRWVPRASASIVVVALVLGGGCQAAHVGKPVAASIAGDDADSQLEFWHSLAEQRIACNDDVFHGLLLYLDKTDPNADYATRVAALRRRGLLADSFARPGDEAVSRGQLAEMLARALHIKGGVTMMVFGPSPRYALREMYYMNLFPPSTPNQTFSGAEFVGIMGKIDDYEHRDSAAYPAAVIAPGASEEAQPAGGGAR